MVILSSLFSYDESIIYPFVDSLNKTGFAGKRFMFTYNSTEKVKKFLTKHNWTVVEKTLNSNLPVHCERFGDFYQFIEKQNFDEQILVTDCRDVYFYINPETIQNQDLYIAPDGLYPLKEHEWGSKEMKNHYPDQYDSLKNNFHLCSGIFYGSKDKVLELCKKTYERILESKIYDTNSTSLEAVELMASAADQMALNVAAYTDLNYSLHINNSIINMCETFWDETITYFIYHQYDRIGNFFDKLSEKTNRLI